MASEFTHTDTNGHVNAIMVVLKVFPQIMTEMICNDFPPQVVLKLIQNNRNFKKNMTEAMMSNLSSTGYNNLDISLLYHIIRYFDLLPEPKQGWGQTPSPTDILKEDDVERMKNGRNDILHRRLGDLSESERNNFFQQSLEIVKRMDSRIGYPQNFFERKFEKMRSYMVTQENYTEALENLVELRGTLQETQVAPGFDLYFGNNINARIVAYEDHDERGDSRRSCTIYLRDPDIDVNDIIQKIDEIKEMIRRGDCAIALEGASIGSLKLHVTIHNKSFRTKEKLHTDIHLFLHEFFVAASIPFKQGHLYTVILAESDYLVEDNEKKKDLDYQKDKQSQVLKLNVNVKESAFQNKFVLYREVKSFIAGMYNVVTRPDVTLIGSARQVFMIADNDIGRDSTSSFRSMQDSKLRSQEPSVLQTVRSTSFVPTVSTQKYDDIIGHASAVMVVLDIYPQIMREMICNKWSPKQVLMLIQSEKGHLFMNNLAFSEKAMFSDMEKSERFDNLDLSCLYKVIRYFNLLLTPTRGWGKEPRPEDQTVGDDVERMKRYRNNIVHRPRGGLSESEKNVFFQQSIDIAKRVDSTFGSPINGFESKIENARSFIVQKEKYTEAIKNCAEYQARLNDTSAKEPYFDLYYGNEIEMKTDALDKSMDDSSIASTIYIKDPNFDVDKVIQMLDTIKETLRMKSFDISFDYAEKGSLNLHVTISDRCFRKKQILHETIQSFLHGFFQAASIPFIQGHIYTVVLGESDY